VVSCLYTQRFKSAPDDLPAIAKQLGVSNVLQGSVQRSADEVRVNVQLVKADTDTHLWADTFDRKLTDIFAVESEIAKTIAETLRARLSGSEERAISFPSAPSLLRLAASQRTRTAQDAIFGERKLTADDTGTLDEGILDLHPTYHSLNCANPKSHPNGKDQSAS